MNRTVVMLSSLALFLIAGCGGTEDDSTATSREATTATCKTVCEKCPPNKICTALCVVRCPPGMKPPAGEACGPTTCGAGEVCCNASCGICTPPDGLCTMQICDPIPATK